MSGRTWLGWVAALLLAAPTAAVAAGPRYYLEIADAQEAPGVNSGLLLEARKLLREQLAKRPEVVLAGAGAPADDQALASWLKKRNLRGYRVFVRITHVGKETLPPRAGRPYKQMQATVRASLLGATLPGGIMALSGDGESSTATEFSGASRPADESALLHDALADALGQAIDRALARLAGSGAHGSRKKR